MIVVVVVAAPLICTLHDRLDKSNFLLRPKTALHYNVTRSPSPLGGSTAIVDGSITINLRKTQNVHDEEDDNDA